MAQAMILDKSLAGEVRCLQYLLLILDQPGKWGNDLETLMNCLLEAKKDYLTLWNVSVDGDLLDAHEKPVAEKQMLMTCYFNIGIDAEIGASNIIVPTKFL